MNVQDALAAKASPVIHTISPAASLDELVAALAEHGVGALVVGDEGTTMLGIVSERDVVRSLAAGPPGGGSVADLMTTDVQVCGPSDSLEHVMRTMTTHRVRHVPVFDGERLVGLLSIGDVVKQRIDELEFERDQLSQYVAGG